MKKIYSTPCIDVISFSDEIILGNNSNIQIRGYNGADQDISLGNGGGAGKDDGITPGAKGSNHSFWDDDDQDTGW